MIEALVLAVCVSGKGCNEATSAYYNYNLDLQDWAKMKQYQIESKFGKSNLTVIGTTAGIIFIRKGSIPVSNHVNLVVDTGATVQLHWEY